MSTKIAAIGLVWLFASTSAAAADGPRTTESPGDAQPSAVPAPPAETSAAPAQSMHPPVEPCATPDGDGPFLISTGCSGVFGLRGSASTVRGTAATEGSGLMVSAEGEEFTRCGLFSGHGMHRLAIGGGGAGFEGTLQGSLAGGFRIPVGARHGPVIRAGILGYLRGNDAFYASLLDLPQVQLGYQYLYGHTVFELGATSGAVLTGRFRAGEAEARRLGAGLEIGAYAGLKVPWFRLGISAMQLPTNDALSSPVRVAEGTLCAIATPFAICADGRLSVADAIAAAGAAPTEVRATYAGLAFGFTRER